MKVKFLNCLNATYTTVENNGDFSVVHNGNKLTIYFEWSDGATDWKNNFNFPAKPYRRMKDLWFCHRGFLKVWKSIEPYVENYILDETLKEIEIIGYSHGGAIAQLCYEYVKFNRPDVAVVGFGFGAPRVFWGFACKRVKARFEDFMVIRNGHDIVTHLPPVLFGFRHLGRVFKIGNSVGPINDHYPEEYLHALEEHKYDEKCSM
jgi:hypothetical protein